MHELTCEWCRNVFLAARLRSKGKPRRFCGRSCSAKWRMSRPEFVKTLDTEKRRETSRRNMKRLRKNEAAMTKLRIYLKSERNPFRDPAVRQKGILVNALKGWPQLRGGNGRGPTVPQAILHTALGLGWEMEVSVKRCKIDIGNRAMKLAIEVDGHSHKTKKVKLLDARKEAMLAVNGWTTLRFWNWQILEKLPAVLKRIKRFTT